MAARRERRSIEIAQKQAERDAEQKEAELKAKLVEEERQKLIAKHAQVGLQISASFTDECPVSHWSIDFEWIWLAETQIVNLYQNLLGFLPKGVIRDYDDLEPLGDDYKQAYKPNLTDDEQ